MKTHNLFLQRKKRLQRLKQLQQRGKEGEPAKQVTCPGCGGSVSATQIRENYKICPLCNHYFPMTPGERIRLLADRKSFRELNRDLTSQDPLAFPGYAQKLQEVRGKTGRADAVMTGVLKIGSIPAAVGVLDSRFLMGSMGTVVGEKVAALAEYASAKKLPLILFSASGGARMQEGMFALMQMAKTATAIEEFKARGGLYISFLTNPTTGGVSASFAGLGDIILAEPRALICFAGPRVIEQTIGTSLPEGFQRSEFLLEHGMLDRVVERKEMRKILYTLLRLHQNPEQIQDFQSGEKKWKIRN